MSNQIDGSGLQVKTFEELLTDLKTQFQSIYGVDINVNSNSPDGQMIGIFAQMIQDCLDLLTQIYSSFDPDQAIGVTQDQRYALNGIKRQGGTFSLTEIVVTTDRALSLQGLDGDIDNPDGTGYTISDNAGTKWVLANSVSIGSSGDHTIIFRAQNLGAVETVVNTITSAVTSIVGVTGLNNPNTQLSVGKDQEADSVYKERRKKSVAISSSGYFEGLLAALLNVDEVTTANVYENVTGSDDGDSIPGHGIWVIVEGGSDADIGKVIYAKRNAGVNMKGAVTYDVTRPNGSTFQVAFDRTATENLKLKFKLDTLSGELTPTATLLSGNAQLTGLSSTDGIKAGHLVRGTNIPASATVVSVDDETPSAGKITISAAPTGSGSETITVVPIVVSDLITAIEADLTPGVYETVDVNELGTIVRSINSSALITFASGQGVSNDGGSTYHTSLAPSAKNKKFTVNSVVIV